MCAEPEQKTEVEDAEDAKIVEVKGERERSERSERNERNDRYGRKQRTTVCWVCGDRTDKHPHSEGRPCRSIGITCTNCGTYGHQASCHLVQDKDAQEALTRRYGSAFLFTIPEAADSKKRTVGKQNNTKEVKRVKKETPYKQMEQLESDED